MKKKVKAICINGEPFPDLGIKPELELNPDEDIITGKFKGVKKEIYNKANTDLKAKCDTYGKIYEDAFLGKTDKNKAILLLENKKNDVAGKLERIEKLRNPCEKGITVSGNDINLVTNKGYYNLQHDVYTGLLKSLNYWQDRIRNIPANKIEPESLEPIKYPKDIKNEYREILKVLYGKKYISQLKDGKYPLISRKGRPIVRELIHKGMGGGTILLFIKYIDNIPADTASRYYRELKVDKPS
ncbi:MAG: hypothetical protein LBU88_05545 [Treponema sp.]|jgi:hypothetical protein|nr:hypothetical protein [Treponema sp.]